ncbi:lysis system i-spanin subunit Rz [Amantichitinum ursilacus]|uniref:Bacteriophage lysis protein n=1 Tax=Amantichitinum ursilacus TaxID=857265 RepID=A0A0N0GNZ7_9NEIS|nr:lysis system i-spanin subunit Rz [Amantichitinum ursilacus]KPC53043.1 Bacteriophage lysis protein [Amantichitinum ursilacus]
MTKVLPWWVRWAALGVLVVAVATFFYVRGAEAKDAQWSLRDSQRTAMEASAVARLSEQRRRQEAAMASAVAAIDKQRYEEQSRANQENQRMQRVLAAGAVRVRVAARCDAADRLPAVASAAGVGDGTQTAELDPAVASDLESIANDGDAAIRQLTALQEIYASGTTQHK